MSLLRSASWVLAGSLFCCLAKPANASEWKMNPIMSSVEIIPEAESLDDNNRRELVCMALAVYYESRGETLKGQRAVAHVVMNRRNDPAYPSSVCGVVWQRSQFSWTVRPVGALIPHSIEGWKRAQEVAFQVITGTDADDPTDGALNFYARYIRPAWSWVAKLLRIGGHVFVRK